jgi:hypothetical protein
MNAIWIGLAVTWPIMTLAVWSAGAFGVPLVKQSIHEKSWDEARDSWISSQARADSAHARIIMRWIGYSLRWFGAGLIWPVSIPLYLSYKKGSFLLELGKKNEELDEINQKILRASANLSAIKDQLADAKADNNVLRLHKN